MCICSVWGGFRRPPSLHMGKLGTKCREQGSIPERGHSHTSCLHDARFRRGDSPVSQQSHTQITHREGELAGQK